MSGEVYVLKCELGKYYVGFAPNFDRRVYKHVTGEGAVWTRLYKPVDLIVLTEGDLYKERAMTLVYMRKYGWDNVRGGPWTQVDLGAPHVFKFPTLEEADKYRFCAIPPRY